MHSDLDRQFRRFCQDGDLEALAEVFTRTAPKLLRQARRLLRDAVAAEDAVQDLFLSLLHRQGAYDPKRPCLPFLYGAMARHAMRQHRRRMPAGDASAIAGEADAMATVDANDAARFALATLQNLPAPYREVATLFLADGCAPIEIARRLQRPAGTIRVQLHRALTMMRRAMPPTLAVGFLLANLGRPANAGAPAAWPGHRVWSAPAIGRIMAAGLIGIAALALGSREVSPPGGSTNQTGAQHQSSSAPVDHSAPLATQRTQADSALQRVRVVNSQGRGIPSVGLRIVDAQGDPDLDVHFRVTDAQGCASVASLGPGDYKVWTDRGPKGWLHVAPDRPVDLTLTVEGGITVRGKAVHGDGTPIAGADVSLCHDPAQPGEGQVVTHTDAAGQFELVSLLPKSSIGVAAADLAPHRLLLAEAGTVKPLEFRFHYEPTATVRGVVFGDAGRLPDCLVLIGRSPRPGWSHTNKGLNEVYRDAAVRTDANGAFLASGLPPGRLQVIARGRTICTTIANVSVPAGGTGEVMLHADCGHRLRGRVLDEERAPIVDAMLQVEPIDIRQTVRGSTDAGGQFTLHGVNERRILLWATAPGFVSQCHSITDPEAHLEFMLARRPMIPVVMRHGGQPVAPGQWDLAIAEPGSQSTELLGSDSEGRPWTRADRCSWTYLVRRRGAAVWVPCGPTATDPEVVLDIPQEAGTPCKVHLDLRELAEPSLRQLAIVVERAGLRQEVPATPCGAALVELLVPAGMWRFEFHSPDADTPSFGIGCHDIVDPETTIVVPPPPYGFLCWDFRVTDGTAIGNFDALLTSETQPPITMTTLTGRRPVTAGAYELSLTTSVTTRVSGHTVRIESGQEAQLSLALARAFETQVGFWTPPGLDLQRASLQILYQGKPVYRRPARSFRSGPDGYAWNILLLPRGDYVFEILSGDESWRGHLSVTGESPAAEPALVSLERASRASPRDGR